MISYRVHLNKKQLDYIVFFKIFLKSLSSLVYVRQSLDIYKIRLAHLLEATVNIFHLILLTMSALIILLILITVLTHSNIIIIPQNSPSSALFTLQEHYRQMVAQKNAAFIE